MIDYQDPYHVDILQPICEDTTNPLEYFIEDVGNEILLEEAFRYLVKLFYFPRQTWIQRLRGRRQRVDLKKLFFEQREIVYP